MPSENDLNFVQKRFLVQQFACFEPLSAVGRAFKETFGFELKPSRIAYYNAGTASAAGLAPELKALFDTTRAEFLKNLDRIPIANKAVQLRALDRALTLAESRGQIAMVVPLVEAAAAIMGTIAAKSDPAQTAPGAVAAVDRPPRESFDEWTARQRRNLGAELASVDATGRTAN